MFKRILSTLFVLSLSVMLLPASSVSAQQVCEYPDEPVRIGFAAHSIELQALFGQLREGFRQTLDDAGLEYEFLQAAPENSSDHARMVSILEDYSTAGLDYVLVGPTSLALNEPGLNAVAESGARLLMTDYEPPAETAPYMESVLNWVVYSHDEMGYKAGLWLANHFRETGNYEPEIVMLWGPAASEISEARGGGVLRALEEAEDLTVNVVYEAYADFNRERAYTETERALAAYDFDAVVGLNSYMAVSAKDALLANNMLQDVTVVGMGGTIDELQAVALDEIGVAPFRDPRSMGAASANALLLHLCGREAEIEEVSYATIPIVDSALRIVENVPSDMFDVVGFLRTYYSEE